LALARLAAGAFPGSPASRGRLSGGGEASAAVDSGVISCGQCASFSDLRWPAARACLLVDAEQPASAPCRSACSRGPCAASARPPPGSGPSRAARGTASRSSSCSRHMDGLCATLFHDSTQSAGRARKEVAICTQCTCAVPGEQRTVDSPVCRPSASSQPDPAALRRRPSRGARRCLHKSQVWLLSQSSVDLASEQGSAGPRRLGTSLRNRPLSTSPAISKSSLG